MASAKYVKKIDSGDAFHIEEELSESKVSFARKHSRREKLLFVVVLIAVVLAVVFIILYAKQVSKAKASTAGSEGRTNTEGSTKTTDAPTKGSTKTTDAPSKGGLPVCISSDCVLISSGNFT